MQVSEEYSLTMVEKELLKEYLSATLKNEKIIILGAQEISEKLDLSRPRVYAILINLESKGILEKFKRKGFLLTEKGESLIHEINHSEKILETYFFQELDFPLEQASEEASNLSIYTSSHLINALCEKIGMPNVCPHGIAINHNTLTH